MSLVIDIGFISSRHQHSRSVPPTFPTHIQAKERMQAAFTRCMLHLNQTDYSHWKEPGILSLMWEGSSEASWGLPLWDILCLKRARQCLNVNLDGNRETLLYLKESGRKCRSLCDKHQCPKRPWLTGIGTRYYWDLFKIVSTAWSILSGVCGPSCKEERLRQWANQREHVRNCEDPHWGND